MLFQKNSLLYSAFTVLNEINNIKIDGEEISVELKQGIYKDLFEKSNKVKVFDLKKVSCIKWLYEH